MSTRGALVIKKNNQIEKEFYIRCDAGVCSFLPNLLFSINSFGFLLVVEELMKINSQEFDFGSENLPEHLEFCADILRLQPEQEFYKNGLFCEYAYFLDAEKNSITVFTGLHSKPQVGFTSWYYQTESEKFYMHKFCQINIENNQ